MPDHVKSLSREIAAIDTQGNPAPFVAMDKDYHHAVERRNGHAQRIPGGVGPSVAAWTVTASGIS